MMRELNLAEVIRRTVLARTPSKSGSYPAVRSSTSGERGDPKFDGGSFYPTTAQEGVDALGGYFEREVQIEYTAVFEYETMVAELRGLRSPADFIERAAATAADSSRNARQLSSLASRFGVDPTPPRLSRNVSEDLFEFALGIARRSCVFETYRAAKTSYQAKYASDEEICRVIENVADAYLARAQLSWDLYGWLQGQLSPSRCGKLRTAQREALYRLQTDHNHQRLASWQMELVGELEREEEFELIERMELELWSHALAA